MKTPEAIVQHMLTHDRFSQWLGLEVLRVSAGKAHLKMQVRKEMLNGFDVLHGGVVFALADSAFAFACNSRNNLSLALDAQISFMKKAQAGDVLEALVEELHDGKTTGVYEVKVTKGSELIAAFRGTAFRTQKELL